MNKKHSLLNQIKYPLAASLAIVAIFSSACTSSNPAAAPAPSSSSTIGIPATTAATTTTSTKAAAAPASISLVAGKLMYAVVPPNCKVVGSNLDYLPDSSCTPGAINPDVNQSNIQSTICVSGYTKTIRPSSSFTTNLKKQQMAAWGITGSTRTIEEDHLVSLELGGAPSDSRNLWPEQGGIPNVKDKLENVLKKMICSGQITLTTAQQAISSNWETAYTKYIGPLPTN